MEQNQSKIQGSEICLMEMYRLACKESPDRIPHFETIFNLMLVNGDSYFDEDNYLDITPREILGLLNKYRMSYLFKGEVVHSSVIGVW